MCITETIFWAHLQCQTKSYLKAAGAVGEQRAFSEWEGKLVEDFQRAFCLQLRLNYADDAYMVGCSLSQALDKQCSLVFDCTVQTHELQSSIPLLERVPSSATAPHNLYIPVRFLPREKLTPHDKLLLAFDALVLSVAMSQAPPFGKIIHGSAYAVANPVGYLDGICAGCSGHDHHTTGPQHASAVGVEQALCGVWVSRALSADGP